MLALESQRRVAYALAHLSPRQLQYFLSARRTTSRELKCSSEASRKAGRVRILHELHMAEELFSQGHHPPDFKKFYRLDIATFCKLRDVYGCNSLILTSVGRSCFKHPWWRLVTAAAAAGVLILSSFALLLLSTASAQVTDRCLLVITLASRRQWCGRLVSW